SAMAPSIAAHATRARACPRFATSRRRRDRSAPRRRPHASAQWIPARMVRAQEHAMTPTRHTRKPRLVSSPRLVRQRRLGFSFLLLALAARAGAQAPEPEGLQFAT